LLSNHKKSKVENILKKVIWGGDENVQSFSQDYFFSTFDKNVYPEINILRDFIDDSGKDIQEDPAFNTGWTKYKESLKKTFSKSDLSVKLYPEKNIANYSTFHALRDEKSGHLSGNNGGNIEALPGGFCLSGDNQDWKNFTSGYCGKKENHIKFRTKWLYVGHVDEIVSLIPDNNQPKSCNFALQYASPKKALELLRQHPNDNFFNFKKESTFLQSNHENGYVNYFCEAYLKQKGLAKNTEKLYRLKPNNNLHNYFLRKKSKRKIASLEHLKMDNNSLKNYSICKKIKNSDFLDFYKKSAVLKANNLSIETIIKNDTKKAVEKIKKRTGCDVKAAAVPQLFYQNGFSNEKKIEINFKDYEDLKIDQRMDSIFPNPANSVLLSEKNILYPEPHNESFKNYLIKLGKIRGFNANFYETWDNFHTGSGNIHCVVNTIRVCKP